MGTCSCGGHVSALEMPEEEPDVDVHGETGFRIQKMRTLPSNDSRKVRPLLSDLQSDFKSYADKDGMIDASRLKQVWTTVASRRCGQLSESETALIEKSADRFLSSMDLRGTGMVSLEEFELFMLGGSAEKGAMRNMRAKMKDLMDNDPEKLRTIIQRYKAWDEKGKGFVSKADLTKHIDELVELLGNSAADGQELIDQLFEDIDVEGKGYLDLWEVMAHALGRRKTPVELLLYDISNGIAERFSSLCLGEEFEAIYHTSILVFGKEYWYGGQVFRSTPPCDKTFGWPLEKSKLPLRPSSYHEDLVTVHIGYTMLTLQEWHHYVNKDMAKRFTRDAYDVLTYNCNTFSDDGVHFLTGGHIPEAILNLPKLALESRTGVLMRPFLNQWLGGFGDSSGSGLQDAEEGLSETKPEDIIKKLTLGSGRVVVVKGAGSSGEDVLATIVRVMNEDHCEVNFFDPERCAFVKKGVWRDMLERTRTDHEKAMNNQQTWVGAGKGPRKSFATDAEGRPLSPRSQLRMELEQGGSIMDSICE
eukprot:TRINITY_DN13934_c0_g1_i1.p1 TRINITY_DN13934_c0_g1~~TRINITY_DN13934_c0_g1_i1.p1  ORF type:complete len:532 (-),score=145.07 TRINITY_DN13934_c0_g1_i1:209-1804(-)